MQKFLAQYQINIKIQYYTEFHSIINYNLKENTKEYTKEELKIWDNIFRLKIGLSFRENLKTIFEYLLLLLILLILYIYPKIRN